MEADSHIQSTYHFDRLFANLCDAPTISEERQNLATQFETGIANQMAAFDQEPITRFHKMPPSRSTLMSKYGNG